LTDLAGDEREKARRVLKETISLFEEPHIPSADAAADAVYQELGLTDSAISVVAREYHCTVLTDDLDLFLRLQRDDLDAVNFTHLRARVNSAPSSDESRVHTAKNLLQHHSKPLTPKFQLISGNPHVP
jgi:hypothetical protein